MGPGGYPILCVAAASGNTGAVEALLCAGADLEVRGCFASICSMIGWLLMA